jgi:hypothetical protein
MSRNFQSADSSHVEEDNVETKKITIHLLMHLQNKVLTVSEQAINLSATGVVHFMITQGQKM